MKQMLNSRVSGLILVTLLSTLLLIIFYGKILFHLNTTFFSLSGDGIQTYFNTSYQIKHDSSLLHTNSMNYPYGEIYIYTQPQILITGPVKFISRHIVDISDYTVGIINSWLLISVVLCSIFLYLTLHNLGLPVWISVLAATGISFLSPQMDRMGGHFTLAYCWAIPALIYFLQCFHLRNAKVIYSLCIGLSLFILLTGHIYFIVFYFGVLLVYWPFTYKRQPLAQQSTTSKLAHISVQFILPLLAYFIIVGYFSDTATERPSIPYGFLIYLSRPDAVFLPIGMPYGRFLHKIWDFSRVQWEGMAYVGIAATLGCVILLILLFIKYFKKQRPDLIHVTDNYFLNVIFWSSVSLLLLSFGMPFKLGLQKLVDYIGPLKQLRALGRFTWLFFYAINLVVLYRIYASSKVGKWRTILVAVFLILLYVDVYFHNHNRQNFLNNTFPEWSDYQNVTDENKIIGRFNQDAYQAIIPIPFYHMGSEHFNFDVRCRSLANSCLVSYKTGLPIMAIYSGRASIVHSVKNIELAVEPYRKHKIIQDLPSRKPLLIAHTKCDQLTPEERNLLDYSVLIDSTSSIEFYRLDIDSLEILPIRKKQSIIKKMDANPEITGKEYLSIPETRIVHRSFDEMQVEGYIGNGTGIKGKDVFEVFQGTLNNSGLNNYTISFWLSQVNKDLIAKTRLELSIVDSGGALITHKNVMCGNFLKVLDGPWGLIEFPIENVHPEHQVNIKLFNKLIKNKSTYVVDEIMIRPDSCDVMQRGEQCIMLNNRWFPN